MNEQRNDDDWRLQQQEVYLLGATLYWTRWTRYEPAWDHDHCAFCWPWYRRTLTLAYLEERDVQQVDALILRVLKAPPEAAIPDTLEFWLNWPDRRSVQLAAGGVAVSRKGRQTLYRWDELQRVEIWRLESDRRDFRELRVQLPDQECKLRAWSYEGQECRNWSGASAEAISACVSSYFQQPQLRDFSLHGTPRTLDEIDARQERDDAISKELLRIMKWCVRLAWGCTLAVLVLLPWPGSLLMAGMTGMLSWAFQWMYADTARHVERRRSNREAERSAFTERQT
ncbi:MAG: hypothetical protein ACT4QC_13520 [Planctomycetaceae bacterium]